MDTRKVEALLATAEQLPIDIFLSKADLLDLSLTDRNETEDCEPLCNARNYMLECYIFQDTLLRSPYKEAPISDRFLRFAQRYLNAI